MLLRVASSRGTCLVDYRTYNICAISCMHIPHRSTIHRNPETYFSYSIQAWSMYKQAQICVQFYFDTDMYTSLLDKNWGFIEYEMPADSLLMPQRDKNMVVFLMIAS